MSRFWEAVSIGLLLSIALLPNISLGGSLPSVRPEDTLIFLLLLLGARRLKLPNASDRRFNNYLVLLLITGSWMAVCLLGNGRFLRISDHFEFYKLAKYAILAIFSYAVLSRYPAKHCDRLMYVVFALLATFNLANYLDLFGFNHSIMPWYTSADRIASFGQDSMGNPATRRMLGTMGNPNNNGVLWSLVAAYFLSRQGGKIYHLPLFLISLAMVMLSGSRTAFVGVMAMVFLYWLIGRHSAGQLALSLAAVALAFAVVVIFNIQYISMLWTTDLMENPSWLARLGIWKHLADMIINSPLIGYGPNKEYFYQNNLYSENEYLLMAWRYGIPGLLMYLGLFLIPTYQALRSRVSETALLVIMASAVMAISALTNNPFSEPRLVAIYALVVGAFYAQRQNAPESPS